MALFPPDPKTWVCTRSAERLYAMSDPHSVIASYFTPYVSTPRAEILSLSKKRKKSAVNESELATASKIIALERREFVLRAKLNGTGQLMKTSIREKCFPASEDANVNQNPESNAPYLHPYDNQLLSYSMASVLSSAFSVAETENLLEGKRAREKKVDSGGVSLVTGREAFVYDGVGRGGKGGIVGVRMVSVVGGICGGGGENGGDDLGNDGGNYGDDDDDDDDDDDQSSSAVQLFFDLVDVSTTKSSRATPVSENSTPSSSEKPASKNTHLRLCQHTLPRSIPVTEIAAKHFGPNGMLPVPSILTTYLANEELSRQIQYDDEEEGDKDAVNKITENSLLPGGVRRELKIIKKKIRGLVGSIYGTFLVLRLRRRSIRELRKIVEARGDCSRIGCSRLAGDQGYGQVVFTIPTKVTRRGRKGKGNKKVRRCLEIRIEYKGIEDNLPAEISIRWVDVYGGGGGAR